LEVFDRDHVKHFVRELLGKIANAPEIPKYKYVFFDCPPNFSVLSYSTLATCKLILVPVNPDFYAARGLSLILKHLKLRIEPFPLPDYRRLHEQSWLASEYRLVSWRAAKPCATNGKRAVRRYVGSTALCQTVWT
jgi:hypothetical protein